jgi:hypothetical protein
MSHNKYSYARSFNLGGSKKQQYDDPIAMCLSQGLDRKFSFGGAAGNLTGPQSSQCQNLFADRCSKNWDGFCEYYYREYGKDGSVGNNKLWPDVVGRQWESKYNTLRFSTLGDQMLRNTAERKYCTYVNCSSNMKPFNPLDPNSPYVQSFNGGVNGCVPICGNIDPKTIDYDPVMDRMLENSDAVTPTLVNICYTAQQNGINLDGTKIGRVCSEFKKSLA